MPGQEITQLVSQDWQQQATGDISGTPNNVTGTDQTVTYTITPTSAAGCVGNSFSATVIVRSEPVGVATPATQTVCSDAAITTIVLSTSNSMAGTTYAWTRDNTVGVTGTGSAGSGDISGTPNNVTGTDQTVTYTITPTSAAGCVGNSFYSNSNSTIGAGRSSHTGHTDRLFGCSHHHNSAEHEQQHGRNDVCLDKR